MDASAQLACSWHAGHAGRLCVREASWRQAKTLTGLLSTRFLPGCPPACSDQARPNSELLVAPIADRTATKGAHGAGATLACGLAVRNILWVQMLYETLTCSRIATG